MAHPSTARPTEKAALYAQLDKQLAALMESCPLPLPALSNCAALLWTALSDVSWCGFYLFKNDSLYLGPFQGKVACTVIPVGKGVCGTAAATRLVQVVPDVRAFPGHIACDSASRSEIVVPILRAERLLGVMDLDSPLPARFDAEDASGLTVLCARLADGAAWEGGL